MIYEIHIMTEIIICPGYCLHSMHYESETIPAFSLKRLKFSTGKGEAVKDLKIRSG